MYNNNKYTLTCERKPSIEPQMCSVPPTKVVDSFILPIDTGIEASTSIVKPFTLDTVTNALNTPTTVHLAQGMYLDLTAFLAASLGVLIGAIGIVLYQVVLEPYLYNRRLRK